MKYYPTAYQTMPAFPRQNSDGSRLKRAFRQLKPLLKHILILCFAAFALSTSVQAQPGNGYEGHSYLASGEAYTTGEKAESKLWWNDCAWWASMFNEETRAYHIYRLDQEEQVWIDTETLIDERNASRADILWDETVQTLYVASHRYANTPRLANRDEEARLYRYHYDAHLDRYILDSGFPVEIASIVPRMLTMTKDSSGWLWTTYVWNETVLVQYSMDDGTVWSEPYALPGEGNSVRATDISAIIAFGDKIGVAWTNQQRDAIYFAVHDDGDPTENWSEEVVITGGRIADDHLNLAADSEGRVFLATKTSNNSGADPLILIHNRQTDGRWSSHTFGYQRDAHTRPVILVDEQNEQLYVFATSPQTGGVIYYKTTPIDHIHFEDGRGTPVIRFPDATINNVTSTKQPVSSATGLVILASAANTRRYYHNNLLIEGDEDDSGTIGAFCPNAVDAPSIPTHYISSTSTVNVRTEPNTNATVMASLPPGAEVVVVGEVEGAFTEGSNLWAQIEIDGQIAYIHSRLLTRLP